MINKPLPNWKRWAFAASGVMGIVFFVLFGVTFFIVPEELPALARYSFIVASLFGLCWAVACFFVVKKGTMNLKKEGSSMIGISWIMVVFMMTMFLMLGMQMEDAALGARMILFGLVFLVMGMVFLINHKIELSELNCKESMLKLELQIAELNEQLKNKG